MLQQDKIDAQSIVELFHKTAKCTGTPIAIVIDEFGKNLEYMARYPGQGDIFILQALAEAENIHLWVCLHQAFDEYASGFPHQQIQEWGKVQGRFEKIDCGFRKTLPLHIIKCIFIENVICIAGTRS